MTLRHLSGLVGVACLTAVTGFAVVVAAPVRAATVTGVSRLSVSTGGTQANAESGFGANAAVDISNDGRFVVFASQATNLDPADTDPFTDVFVRDRGDAATGVPPSTRLVSVVDPLGTSGSKSSSETPVISGNGRYVAFTSQSSNLVPSDTNGARDIFVRDLQSNTTRRVSTTAAGLEAAGIIYPGAPSSTDVERGDSSVPTISDDGRYVAFQSWAVNLVPTDTNVASDVFRKDTVTGSVARVSVSATGAQAFGNSFRPSISDNGQRVAFDSGAPELFTQVGPGTRTPGAGIEDVYVWESGTTRLVSKTSAGYTVSACPLSFPPTFRGSIGPSISGNGQFVAFTSECADLIPTDTNGRLDVFMHDLVTGRTTAESVETDGNTAGSGSVDGPLGNGDSAYPSLSSDGRFIAFYTSASDLSVIGDTPYPNPVTFDSTAEGYIRDRYADVTTPITGDVTFVPKINADGTVVAYPSGSAGLVSGDTNGVTDIFVSTITPDEAKVYALPEADALDVMTALAAVIPDLEIPALNGVAGTFTIPGCVSREAPTTTASRPLPGMREDYVLALSYQPYVTVSASTADPLKGPCHPDAVTVFEK